MKTIYEYDGKDTCAADGMCKEKCPVKINTGALIKEIRAHEMQDEHPRYDAVAGVRRGCRRRKGDAEAQYWSGGSSE